MLFHTGDNRYDFSAPARLARAMDQVPDLTCIAAHFGGYSEWESSYEYLCGTDYYFDTSSTLGMMSDFSLPKKMIAKHDENRILFASDFPMWTPEYELTNIEKLGLSQDLSEKILYKNALGLISRAK